MKKWEEPKLSVLGIENTLTDTSYCHECHNIHDNCKDFTNGEHSSHTTPNWNEEHGHTCCCPDTIPTLS